MLLLGVIFAAGAVVGVAVDRLDLFTGGAAAAERADTATSESEERDGEWRGRQTTIEAFADELGLTADQRAQIEAYLDHFRGGARMLQQEVRPRYRALMDSVRTEIEAVLTDEQVEGYRELLRQRHGGGREREPDGRNGNDPDNDPDSDT